MENGLVLSRKRGERVRIGKDIWVTVLEIKRDKVRLGFLADKEIPILRSEIIPDEAPAPVPSDPMEAV